MKYKLLYLLTGMFLFLTFIPTTNAVVHVKGELHKTLNEKQERRIEKFKAKLKKKIEKKKAKAKKKGKRVNDVMDNKKFVLGLILLGGSLALALVAGLFGLGFFGWIAGVIAVVAIVLLILGIIEVT